MSKRSVFTTITPLPAGISRETVMETLRDHLEMIDLNPLVEERHPIKPPPNATPEEYHCLWYSLTDRVQYLPGGMMNGKVNYNACFHDLENGLQTHCYAPMGVNIKGKWTLGGSLPGEPIAPVEIGLGAPLTGLWLREDVDMKCNIMMTSFVKKTLKKAHIHLVDRLVVKAQIVDATINNQQLINESIIGLSSSAEYSPSDYDGNSMHEEKASSIHGSIPPTYNSWTNSQQQGPLSATTSNPSSRSNSTINLSLNDPTLQAHAQIQSAARHSHSNSLSASNQNQPSYNPSLSSNSINQRHNRSNSYQDNRISWQNLIPPPPPKSQARPSSNPNFNSNPSLRPESYQPYKVSEQAGGGYQSYHAVELYGEDRLKGAVGGGNVNYRGQGQRPTVFGAVELE